MRLSIPEHVQIREIDGQWVLLDCRKNRFYAVGKTGADFLKYVQIDGHIEKTIVRLSQSYQVPYETVKQDMNDFVCRLYEKGLLVRT